jgi:REP element-mobilizing transposase RayT
VGLTYSARKKMILQYKPQSEHAMRLRCMWQVTPYQYRQLPKAIREALALWSKGYALWSNGYALCSEGYALSSEGYALWSKGYPLWSKGYALWSNGYALSRKGYPLWSKGDALRSKGYALWSNGYALCSKGYAEHRAELDAWHARYCLAAKTPDGCPWNGERLAGVGN